MGNTNMHILCLSPVVPVDISDVRNYNGGGWIDGFISLIKDIPEITVSICFFTRNRSVSTQTIDGVSYYPVYSRLASKWGKIKSKFFVSDESCEDIEALKRLVDRINPDIVQFFGTEWQAIRLLDRYNAVVHVQGLVSACMNAYLPPAVSQWQLIKSALMHTPLKLLKRGSVVDGMKVFRGKYLREQEMLPCLTHVLGRTEWDRDITRLFAPQAAYYKVNEVLRDSFYRAPKWVPALHSDDPEIHLCSTISDAPYKGLDLIFKTARVFALLTDKRIVWHIYGIDEQAETYFLFRHLYKAMPRVQLVFEGVVSADKLISGLLSCAVYVHPGYIDNSSNSICEAQYVGVPVVATNVGGTSSLIENGKTGLLVAANDPYNLAAAVLKMLNPEQAASISSNEIAAAESRHDKESIKWALVTAYKEICRQKWE